MSEKYVVFKREDIKSLVDEIRESDGQDADIAVDAWRLDDAVVIRKRDVFAPPALDTYANSILAAVEVLRDTNKTGDDGVTPEVFGVIRRLQGIADYFYDQAREAWDTDRKLPD
jgi:hypothetical protein